jgi:hypothetical protein
MGKPSGMSDQMQASQANLADTMAKSGQQSAAEGAKLFNLALPGLEKAEGYYGKLSTGDPAALATANAPAIQQIGEKSNEAKKNIMQDNPRGGERTLALEEADISKGAQISNLTTGSYVGSFPSLAGLGGQNVSQGTAATGTGLQGMNAAANQYGQLQQLSNEQKSQQIGLITGLAGAGATAFACYVAAILFDEWDGPKTCLIRNYLYNNFREHWFWKWPYAAYCRFGPSWAEVVKRNKFWRFVAETVFNRLLARAEKGLVSCP